MDSTEHHLPAAAEPEWLALVRSHVRDIRFGVVQVVVHDGRVTQIERTEKVRLPAEGPEQAPQRTTPRIL